MTDAWISIRNWRKFQHYDPTKRRPVWIKNNLDLLAKDEYRDLTAHQRAVLHGLWLEYASSGCQLAVNTASLSSRLHLKVTRRQLEALENAGWIDIVASKLLADGYQLASPEVETEKRRKTPNPNPAVDVAPNGRQLVEDVLAGRTPLVKDLPF